MSSGTLGVYAKIGYIEPVIVLPVEADFSHGSAYKVSSAGDASRFQHFAQPPIAAV